MQPFIHLHVHSQYSILDGQASIPALVDKAIRDGMKGLALTDHGNMFGIKEFFNLVKKKNGATKDAIKGVQKRIEAIESGAEEVEDKEKELASLQEEKAKLEAKIFKPIFGCEMYVVLNRICYTPGSGQAYHVHHPALYYIRNSISDIHDFCRGKMVNIQQFIQSFIFGISFCITCYDSVEIRIHLQLLQCNLTTLRSFACDKCYN